MGIYIPGMVMPNGGYRVVEIAFDADGHPMALADGGDVFDVIPVPPHGRLIDADKVETERHGNNSQRIMWNNIRQLLSEAETIIPAEGKVFDG